LRPEIKISLYIGFIVSVFLIGDLGVYLLISIVMSIFLFRLPFQVLKKGWIPVCIFLIFTFAGNVLFQRGKILLSIGPVILTEEGLATASLRTMRVFLMIAGAKILTATTGTELLIEGLGKMLKPMARLGMPVDAFLSTMGLTMRSLPGLRDRIMRTYADNLSNGEVKGFRARSMAISSFLMPFFVKSMQSPESFFDDEAQTKKK
jgi:energy-coupling factor transport system permease protein